jgi:uncharacterized protein YukE
MRASADGVMGVEPGALRDAVPEMTALATTLDSTLALLRTALSAEGACWGGDPTGRCFADGYRSLSDQAQQAFADLGRAVRTIGANLTTVADAAQAADERARGRLR